MDPEKARFVRRLAQIGKRRIGRRERCALVPGTERIVIHLESAGEAETAREDEGRNHCRRAIAGLLQPLGNDRDACGEIARVLVHAVPAGIEAGHHRTVRRQRFRDGRVGLAEPSPTGGDGVERRGLDAGSVGPDRVGASGVEGDKQDRRAHDRRTCRGCGRGRAVAARGTGEERERERGALHRDAVDEGLRIDCAMPGSAMSFSIASISTGAKPDMLSYPVGVMTIMSSSRM